MRSPRCRVTAVIVALTAVLAFVVPVVGQVKAPADFTYEQGKDSPGPVTFSHKNHKEKGVEKCSLCHTKIVKMKRGQNGPFTMARMKAGELCGACHNGQTEVAGKTPFPVDDKANCEKCHQK